VTTISPPEPASAVGPHITITVYGIPAPQGSKRHLGNGVMVESSTKVKPWRQAVTYAAREAMPDGWQPLNGPLRLAVVFTFARPKGHFRSGRNAHLLRDAAPPRPAGMPDLSKLVRSTEDALTDAGVWVDDARVVSCAAEKRYARDGHPDALITPGAVIHVRRLDVPEAVN